MGASLRTSRSRDIVHARYRLLERLGVVFVLGRTRARNYFTGTHVHAVESEMNELVPYKYLGKGTYACAFLLQGKERVLRISKFAHQADLVSVIQEELATQTPFVPRVYLNQVVAVKDLLPVYRNTLPICMSKDVPENVSLTVMDYGGEKAQPGDTRSIFFCLLWMLYTSIKRYGFQHRDIKPGNIVYAKATEEEDMCFQLGDQSFRIPDMRVRPMLIDFDMAEVRVDKLRISLKRDLVYGGGTVVFLPPEYLVGVPRHKQHIGGRDVYSLGLSMLEVRLGKPVIRIYDHDELKFVRKSYVAKIMQEMGIRGKHPPDNVARRVEIFTEVFCFLKALHNDRDPPDGLYDDLLWRNNAILNRIMEQRMSHYRELIAELDTTERDFFSRTMSWAPDDRVYNGNMHICFLHPYFLNSYGQKLNVEDCDLKTDTENIWPTYRGDNVNVGLLIRTKCGTCLLNNATYYDNGKLKCTPCAFE